LSPSVPVKAFTPQALNAAREPALMATAATCAMADVETPPVLCIFVVPN